MWAGYGGVAILVAALVLQSVVIYPYHRQGKAQPTPAGFSRQGRNSDREGVGTRAAGDKRAHAPKMAVHAARR